MNIENDIGGQNSGVVQEAVPSESQGVCIKWRHHHPITPMSPRFPTLLDLKNLQETFARVNKFDYIHLAQSKRIYRSVKQMLQVTALKKNR